MDKRVEDAYKIMLTDYRDIITPKELSSILGLGMKSTYALINSGVIPKIPLGKKIKIAKLDVIKYVLQATATTTSMRK